MHTIKVRNLIIGEGIPKVCVPIVGKTEDEILYMAQEIAESSADLAEWRMDWFEAVTDVECVKNVAIKLRSMLGELPLLVTFRSKKEGGEQEISYDRYAQLLHAVADTKAADILDVEVHIDRKAADLITGLKKRGVTVIGSKHDFEKTPSKEEIVAELCYMQDTGAEILKMAVMPHTEKDVLTLLEATEEMNRHHAKCPVVTMSMGELGRVSRVAGETFGSAITFGAVQKTSAPGQISAEKLKKVLEILHEGERV